MIHLWLMVFLVSVQPDTDYSKIFGEDYSEAIEIILTHSDTTVKLAAMYGEDPDIARAVIFPELIRYNIIRDIVEKNTLEIVYINTGMADFSIGPLQIKPSFATRIENYVLGNKKLESLHKYFEFKSDNPVEVRRERLNRLQRYEDQIHYVFAFLNYTRNNHQQLPKKDIEYKIKFISTAYNYDFEARRKKIEEYMNKEFFPWGPLNDRKKYSYADISWFYFKNEIIE